MAETYTSGAWAVKPGEEDAFVQEWTAFVRWASEMPGSGTFRLVRDLDQPNRYQSFAPWESFEAQQAWKELPEFRQRIGRVRAQGVVGHFQFSGAADPEAGAGSNPPLEVTALAPARWRGARSRAARLG